MSPETTPYRYRSSDTPTGESIWDRRYAGNRWPTEPDSGEPPLVGVFVWALRP